MEIQELKARFDALVSQRKTLDQTWEAIATTMMPFRGQFFRDSSSEHEVEWRRPRHIYDSTAPMGIQTLAASLHGSLTSPATRWFSMDFRNPELSEDHEAKIWLQNAVEETYNAIQDSNFNLEANEAYTDLVGFGTTVIIQEEKSETERDQEGDFTFQAIPPEQLYFEPDWLGRCERTYRKMMWTPIQIISKFGADNVPKRIVTQSQGTDLDTKHMVIFAVYRRRDISANNSASILAPKERPFGSKYFMYDGMEQLGEENGYYEMPVYVPRWRKTADSMWGNSPAMMALPDVLTLNELTMMNLQALEKVIDPANMTTERGLLSNLDLSSGGLTVVRDKDSVWAYESRARFTDTRLEKQDLKLAIRQAFFVDQLELKDSPAMTATEVQVRYELMQRLLGPTLGRLENDFLSPLIDRSFNILMRAGRFGDVPDSILELGAKIDIKYIGPLAVAQRKDSTRALQSWIGTLGQMGEIFPEVMDIPDVDFIARKLASYEGVDAECMKSEAKVTTERKKRDEAMKQQQQAETHKTQGEADLVNAEATNAQQQQ